MSRKSVFLKKLVPANRKGWKVFLACTITASIFWLFLTFSRNFETPLVFDIKYKGMPEDKVLVNEPLSQLRLNVKARGFDLFRFSLDNENQSITFDLKDFKQLKKGTASKYSLSLVDSKKKWFFSKKESFKIITYSTDTVHLLFDELNEKTVPVKAAYHFDNYQFKVSKSVLVPDSVVIRGRKMALENINEVSTTNTTITEVNQGEAVELSLLQPSGVMKMIPAQVKLKLKAEKIEDFQKEVVISCNNCPDTLSIKLFPSTAKISFKCTPTEFESLNEEDFSASVKYDEITAESDKLFINLLGVPNEIADVEISPAKADYLIRKK